MKCEKCGTIVSYYIGEPEICPECGDLMFEEEEEEQRKLNETKTS